MSALHLISQTLRPGLTDCLAETHTGVLPLWSLLSLHTLFVQQRPFHRMPPPARSHTTPPSTRTTRFPTRTRTLVLLAAPLAVLAATSLLRSHVPGLVHNTTQLVQQRSFAFTPAPPLPTSAIDKMPFPKEGAEKAVKKSENWMGRTYNAREEKEFGRLGERMEDFHSE
jgi:hypothetical protein